MIFEHSVGSCNSSSISHNLGLSVCLPATSFIEELCCLQCIYVVSINVAQIIRSFCSHIMQFQLQQQFYGSQYQSVCLSATSFMEVLCCYQCIIVVTVIVVCNIKNILLSYFAILAAITALQAQCLLVCLSVHNEFMEVLCCYKWIIVVTVVVVYDIRTFCCNILHFQTKQQL